MRDSHPALARRRRDGMAAALRKHAVAVLRSPQLHTLPQAPHAQAASRCQRQMSPTSNPRHPPASGAVGACRTLRCRVLACCLSSRPSAARRRVPALCQRLLQRVVARRATGSSPSSVQPTHPTRAAVHGVGRAPAACRTAGSACRTAAPRRPAQRADAGAGRLWSGRYGRGQLAQKRHAGQPCGQLGRAHRLLLDVSAAAAAAHAPAATPAPRRCCRRRCPPTRRLAAHARFCWPSCTG